MCMEVVHDLVEDLVEPINGRGLSSICFTRELDVQISCEEPT